MLILSDSHGRLGPCLEAVERTRPHVIVHLGDCSADAEDIKKQFPDTPLHAVRGNCDMVSFYPDRELFSFGAARVFITHGHLYAVKRQMDSLLNAGHFSGAQLVLFGHTHLQSFFTAPGGIQVLNPGSIRDGKYATAELDGRGGLICRLWTLGREDAAQ